MIEMEIKIRIKVKEKDYESNYERTKCQPLIEEYLDSIREDIDDAALKIFKDYRMKGDYDFKATIKNVETNNVKL